MTVNVNFTFDCDSCNKIYDNEIFTNVMCDGCLEKHSTVEIREALKKVIKNHYLWNDRDVYSGCSEEEKTIYMKGVKKGYLDALFWMADYFDEIEYWEKLEEEIK